MCKKYCTQADLVREFFLVPSLSLSQQGERKGGPENEVDQSYQALKLKDNSRCTMSNFLLQNEHILKGLQPWHWFAWCVQSVCFNIWTWVFDCEIPCWRLEKSLIFHWVLNMLAHFPLSITLTWETFLFWWDKKMRYTPRQSHLVENLIPYKDRAKFI